MRVRPTVLAAVFSLPIAGLLPAQIPGPMAPFTMEYRRGTLAASPADLSFLLDAPAGKRGFVYVKDGHLASGDGRRLRLWGVNITDWSPGSRQIPSKTDAAYWAAALARFGVNCVRFQFLDLQAPRGLIESGDNGARALDPQQVDREDFFIAELEKRGIYIDFNLLVGRPFQASAGVRDANLLREGAKGTSLFDRRLIELQKDYARELLDHRNPYTHRKYTADPAVALVEINNENALNIGYRAPSPFYLRELTESYNQWLATRRTPEKIAELREIAGVHAGEQVPLLTGRIQAASAPPARFYAEAEFYDWVQRGYFTGMENYLKQTLGSKSLVIATADHSHAGSGYPMLLATSSMDVIDGHDYWQHPGMYVRKSPMVNDPLNSTVVELSRSALAGKPYTVSEVNEPFPNAYESEQIPILASYALLQDWDGVIWYTFEPKADPAWKPYVGDPFDISQNPVKMPELAWGALLFLRGDLEKAVGIDDRSYTQKQVFDSMLLPAEGQRPYFTPGFPPYLPLEDEVRIASLRGAATPPFASRPIPNPIVSDTHQLAWYSPPAQSGLVTVDSPRTQALVGFVRANRKRTANLAAQVGNSFCSILLSSLDGRPIAQSASMLLVAGGRVENTGQQWNTAGTALTAWGGYPTLIRPVQGTIVLRRLEAARRVLVQPLDGAGQPKGPPIRAARNGEDWSAPIGQTVTTWYEIVVER